MEGKFCDVGRSDTYSFVSDGNHNQWSGQCLSKGRKDGEQVCGGSRSGGQKHGCFKNFQPSLGS
jgi:hypothetical protein